MRDRLIELLDNSPQLDALYGDYDKAADWLINNGVTVQEWISVKDRLPEKDEYVWCYSNRHGGYRFVGYRGYISGEFMEGGCLHIGEVTHWTPLPQPPKGE